MLELCFLRHTRPLIMCSVSSSHIVTLSYHSIASFLMKRWRRKFTPCIPVHIRVNCYAKVNRGGGWHSSRREQDSSDLGCIIHDCLSIFPWIPRSTTTRLQLHDYPTTQLRLHDYTTTTTRLRLHDYDYTTTTTGLRLHDYTTTRLRLHDCTTTNTRLRLRLRLPDSRLHAYTTWLHDYPTHDYLADYLRLAPAEARCSLGRDRPFERNHSALTQPVVMVTSWRFRKPPKSDFSRRDNLLWGGGRFQGFGCGLIVDDW